MSKKSPSILHRIVWLHLLALAGISVGISAAAYFLLNSTMTDFEDRLLREHATSVSHYLKFASGSWRLKLPPDLQAIYVHGYGGFALAVVGDDSRVIYSSLPNDSAFLSEPHGTQPEFFHQSRGTSVYYGVTMPIAKNGRSAWIQLGQNLENPDVIVDDVVALFLSRIVWFVLAIFAILLVADIMLMRRLLAPIIAASHVASSIGPNRPPVRLPTRNLPREVLPLAEAVNEALERLDKGILAQREFTADAAHELRTPLAILRTHVDTNLDSKTALALQNDIDAMSRIVDQLLELAELEGFSAGWGERIDLNALCADVVGMMAPIALAENKSLELVSNPVPEWTFGNADMLARALRNLVENAIRYSKVEKTITVEIVPPTTIHVKDWGPGITPSERVEIFQRFWRKNRQDRGHAGLGLAIVSKIVLLHGGSLSVSDREGGGAVFTIVLPVNQRRSESRWAAVAA